VAAEYETRRNWAMLYPAKKKSGDWQADYIGVVVIDGAKFWISAWNKTSATGEHYLSVNVRKKEEAKT
jgi:uncharacterized protein (DUF736 family)